MKRVLKNNCHCRVCIPANAGNPGLKKDFSNKQTGWPVHAGHDSHDSKEQTATAGNDSVKRIHGFTLIELLVVVLIIGILAAVALPQYQKTVAQVKAKEALLVLYKIAEAEVLYKTENGEYTADKNNLSISFPTTSSSYTYGISKYDFDGHLDIRANGSPSLVAVQVTYKAKPAYINCIPGGSARNAKICNWLGAVNCRAGYGYPLVNLQL